MRIHNDTDEPIVIRSGEHVDCEVGVIRKNGGKIAVVVIENEIR